MNIYYPIKKTLTSAWAFLTSLNIRVGISPTMADANTLILFPWYPNTLCCGICALVTFTRKKHSEDISQKNSHDTPLDTFMDQADQASSLVQALCESKGITCELPQTCEALAKAYELSASLKQESVFAALYFNGETYNRYKEITAALARGLETLDSIQRKALISAPENQKPSLPQCMETLSDLVWCMEKEILANVENIQKLYRNSPSPHSPKGVGLFWRLNAVLNSIDRLEVRGRDSAGISLMVTMDRETGDSFIQDLENTGLSEQLMDRSHNPVLSNKSISMNTFNGVISICFTYKFAAEIGSLGDNVAFLRTQIKTDAILQRLTLFSWESASVSAHTRWASVGDITQANCHPVDNATTDTAIIPTGAIHVCLNGDIDNYLDLKTEYEALYDKVHEDINTDTKIIPLQIEHHLRQGADIETAFRLAANDFTGSHAISMHTDLAPGKLFLAQKGSGQALFVGIAPDHYIAASELYGIVEQTNTYIRLNGETKGQVVILDQNSSGLPEDIQSCYYNHEPISLTSKDVKTSLITSRDIDRQGFAHYFLKEISQGPSSVRKTIENTAPAASADGSMEFTSDLLPEPLKEDLQKGVIKKIRFIGQGTAGIAAQGCAHILSFYLTSLDMDIKAEKSSELSGFSVWDAQSEDAMADTLVVAISQSGSTTDTNRTVDMVKKQGARTLAIVNRRDSDLGFKVDAVLYTSSGRDIEMSVASTKAFYAQITAGAALGLHIALCTGARPFQFIAGQINELELLASRMEAVLATKERIQKSASALAAKKDHWAAVGSGPNKTAADEIRIKLSELCYKTISTDFVEDKKHIDLSSEPLIIVCAAGTRESVLTDIIKDTAIFAAHKAAVVVIAQEGDDRFDPYTDHVLHVPAVPEHFAPVLNTMVGHLWGYYAALAIHKTSNFLFQGRTRIHKHLDWFSRKGQTQYEILLEKPFRETIARFYREFIQKLHGENFPPAMGLQTTTNIVLLLKYLSGRLPVSDFELDFGVKGTPVNMLSAFFENMGEAINTLARPVDAIKHQAKTVTVGTSRTAESFDGPVFEELRARGILISQITNKNVLVIKHLQAVISQVKGALLYQIRGLNLLGEVTDKTSIHVVEKTGVLEHETSRIETDHTLKGTKNIIVREGNVYIGKGRKDRRNILIVPVLSPSPETPNIIEYLLSLNVDFLASDQVPLRQIHKNQGLGHGIVQCALERPLSESPARGNPVWGNFRKNCG